MMYLQIVIYDWSNPLEYYDLKASLIRQNICTDLPLHQNIIALTCPVKAILSKDTMSWYDDTQLINCFLGLQ